MEEPRLRELPRGSADGEGEERGSLGLALEKQPGVKGDRTSGVNTTPTGPGASVWNRGGLLLGEVGEESLGGQPLAPGWLDRSRQGPAGGQGAGVLGRRRPAPPGVMALEPAGKLGRSPLGGREGQGKAVTHT